MCDWPASLRLRTRKFLDGIDPFPCGDILHMKNTSVIFAYIKKEDLLNGEIILYDKETKLITKFCSAGEMFDAGWVVDIKKLDGLKALNSNEHKTSKENRIIVFKKL